MIRINQLLRDLIALPSVNPAFVPAGHPRSGEQRVTEFLAALAVRNGLDFELQPVLPGRSNLLVTLSPGKARRRIVMAPHLDTVDGADSQFRPVLRNGRIYGRGACDTKGSVAAMLAALIEVAQSGRRPAETEVIFAGVVDEENAQAGSRALAATGLKADLAIVGEPTRLKVVTAHKGNLWMRLETRGRAAHGSRPELGRNAVHLMARVVDVIETEYASMLRSRRHPLLGSATASVGTIRGGMQPNIVPDRCMISIDRRTLPGETAAEVRRELARLLAKHRLRVTFEEEKLAPCPPMETDPAQPEARRFMSSLRQRRAAGVNFFCDAAVLSEAGIPAVVFGPGDIAHAHTADEWISVSSLERGWRMLVHYLRSLP